MGLLTEPPVSTSRKCDNLNSLVQNKSVQTSILSFEVSLADNIQVNWETVKVDQKLFVEVPNGILPDGSKESFVTLLEYAEDHLKCRHVIVCFKKDRNDRACLVRTFMFLGFSTVRAGDDLHCSVPLCADLLFMAYSIDNDEDELEEEEEEDE